MAVLEVGGADLLRCDLRVAQVSCSPRLCAAQAQIWQASGASHRPSSSFWGRESEDEIQSVLVAAPSAARGLRKFHSRVPSGDGFLIKPLDGDPMDPATWQALYAAAGRDARAGSALPFPGVLVSRAA